MKERIKEVRKNSGLTQTEFGERIGATRPMIASYEGGAVIPADTVLKLISKEFGVSYEWLKNGTGDMIDPVADKETFGRLLDTYQNLPNRLQMLVDALISMDPEWWKTLDAAFEEIERRRKERGAD